MPPQDANLTPSFGGFGVKRSSITTHNVNVVLAYHNDRIPTPDSSLDAASGSENILCRFVLIQKLDSLVKTRFEEVPAI